MRCAVLGFAVGIWLAQRQPELAAWHQLAWAAAGAAVAYGCAFVVSRLGLRIAGVVLAIAASVLSGFLWASILAGLRLADALPAGNEGRDIPVVGVITGLPQEFERGVRFEFTVENAEAQVPSRLWLAWYRGWHEDEWHAFREVRAGQRWQLAVRLKRPHGNLNPHGFDYEAWLFEHGLRATGYVLGREPTHLLDEFDLTPGNVVERMRERIRERFQQALPDAQYAGVLVALAVGDQRAIEPELWQLFNRTGTTHLMSISGLHITMVSGLVYFAASFLWRRVPRFALSLPAPKAAAIGGWLGGFAYCLLAGFGVPAQRTLFMLSVVAVALLSDRQVSPSRVLAVALGLVLLLDPWAVVSAGFWLSFGAVALLFHVGAGRLSRRHWLMEWGRAQWAVTLGLIPALLALFHQFSLVSPVANAIAIPVISLVVTPIALMAAALPYDPLLQLDHWILSLLMAGVTWLAAFPLAVWQQAAPEPWAVALGVFGCVVLLLPRGVPARSIGVFLLAPLVLVSPDRPEAGTARVTILDVGQGLAVHVQTARHDLIYDAGPQFSRDANSGNRIILPYLRALGVAALQGTIITHQDNDHSGGASAIAAEMPGGWMVTSLPTTHTLRLESAVHRSCTADEAWTWDGVRFEVLHPAAAAYLSPPAKSNELSCVVKLATAGTSMLLTADIEARSEEALLARFPERLHADVLLAPHHGSRMSSIPPFLDAVKAGTIVIPVGYRSRFGHPHPDVLTRYRSRGARVLRTDLDGAVSIRLTPQAIHIETEREQRRRYWHAR